MDTVLATIKVTVQQRRHPSDHTDRDLREGSNMQGGDTHRSDLLRHTPSDSCSSTAHTPSAWEWSQ